MNISFREFIIHGIYPTPNEFLLPPGLKIPASPGGPGGRRNSRLPWRPRREEKFPDYEKFPESEIHIGYDKFPEWEFLCPEGREIPCSDGERNSRLPWRPRGEEKFPPPLEASRGGEIPWMRNSLNEKFPEWEIPWMRNSLNQKFLNQKFPESEIPRIRDSLNQKFPESEIHIG